MDNDIFSDLSPALSIGTPTAPAPLAVDTARQAFDMPEIERAEAMEKAHRAEWAQLVLDRAVDFDQWEPQGDPYAKKRAVVESYLDLTLGPASDPASHDLRRVRIAQHLFDGQGADSDDDFFAAIQAQGQQRRDTIALFQDIGEAGARHQLMAIAGDDRATAVDWTSLTNADPSGRFFSPSPEIRTYSTTDWQAWREANKDRPGYDPAREVDYMTAFIAARNSVDIDVEGFEEPLQAAWNDLRQDGELFDLVATHDQLTPEQRGRFAQALGTLARAMPDDTRRTFLQNLGTASGRSIGQGLENAAGMVFDVANAMGEGMAGSPTATDPIRLDERNRRTRSLRDFASDIRRVAEQDLDPVRPDPSHWLPPTVQQAAFAAPSVITTTLTAALPYVGPVAAFGMIKEPFYQDLRADMLAAGFDPLEASERAESLSTIAAVPAALLDRFGARAITSRLPAVNQALTRAADSMGRNAAVRAGTRTFANAALETGTENTQELMRPLVQSIAAALDEDMPGPDWQAELSALWAATPETFLSILPLAIIGAGGGIARDRRNAAFAEANDLELRAFGLSDARIREIRDAQGTESLAQVVETALAERDPASESATTAVQAIVDQIQSDRDAFDRAQGAGIVPRADRTRDGWTVTDPDTGETIGTAPDFAAATRMALDWAGLKDSDQADETAYLATLLEAGDVVAAQATDTDQTTQTFRPGEERTATEEIAEFPDNEERLMAQVTAAGLDPAHVAVFGNSATEFKKDVRETVNRIYRGASVLDVFHEDVHGKFRRAIQSGAVSQAETVALLRALDTARTRNQRDRGERLLPEDVADADLTFGQIEEGVAMLMESEILRTRKGGGRYNLPPSLVSRNLSALGKMQEGGNQGFMGFLRAMRARFGAIVRRAFQLKRAIATGAVTEAEYESYLDRVMGIREELDFDQMAREAEAAVLDGREPAPIDADNPFSLGYPAYDQQGTVNPWSTTGHRLPNDHEFHTEQPPPRALLGRARGFEDTLKQGGRRELLQNLTEDLPDFDGLTDPKLEGIANDIRSAEPTTPAQFWRGLLAAFRARLSRGDDPVEYLQLALDLFGTETGSNRVMQEVEGAPRFSYVAIDDSTILYWDSQNQDFAWGRMPDNAVPPYSTIAPGDSQYSLGSRPLNPLPSEYRHESHADLLVLDAARTARTARARTEGGPRAASKADARGKSRDRALKLGEGEESNIYPLPDGRALKLIKESGIYVHRRDGRLDRSTEAKDIALKAIAINALDGLPTSAVSLGNETALVQDRGTPVTEDEVADLQLPFNIRPGSGHSHRLELDGRHFLVSDLHPRNFLRDSEGTIRIADLIVGEIDPEASALPDIPTSQFSLGPSTLAGPLARDAEGRATATPRRRLEILRRIQRNLEALHLTQDRLNLQRTAPRASKSLRKEAAMRQALRTEELENQAYATHFAILSDESLAQLSAQPLHGYFSKTRKDGRPDPLHGRIMSRSAAAKAHPDMFRDNNPGDYDGADAVSPTVFGGSLMPDQAAQEAHDAGLIPAPTTDALWQALTREAQTVAQMKEALAGAKADLRAARETAKRETTDWLREQTADQNEAAKVNPKAEALDALATLDGILKPLPPEIRAKVGGYTTIARLTTTEARLKELRARLAKADAELKKFLRTEYDREFKDILDRTKPENPDAGDKPRGKIDADAHALFAKVREYFTLSVEEVEAEAVKIESLAADEDADFDEGQRANMEMTANMVRLAGAWHSADLGRKEQAIDEALRIYDDGLQKHLEWLRAKRDRYRAERAQAIMDTGKEGTMLERSRRRQKDRTTKGATDASSRSLFSFDQALRNAFGHDSTTAEMFTEWEKRAAYQKHDALMAKHNLVDELFNGIARGPVAGAQLRWRLSQDYHTVKAPGATPLEMTELEMIQASLMWDQEDGRRHMEGHLDEAGKPVGDWHYNQAFMDRIEELLSDEAKHVRHHIREQYAAEHARLNKVFRALYDLDLPRHDRYAPLTVENQQIKPGQMVDPVTGFAVADGLMTPGSLKSRSPSAIAEPRFRDALQTYLGHSTQMEHWMAYAPLVLELLAVTRHKSVKDSIVEKIGEEGDSVLGRWVEYWSQGGNKDVSAQLEINRKLNKTVSRLAAAALFGRISAILIQSTQLGAGLAEMPTGAFLKRFGMLMSGRLGWGKAIKSEFIQRRMQEMPPAVRLALEGVDSHKPNAVKFAAHGLGRAIGGMDALMTAGTYAITYDYHFTHAPEGMTQAQREAYATAAAERATERVAQPVRPGMRSLWENTATNPGARLLFAFGSEARQKIMLTAYQFYADRSASEKARAIAVTWLIGGGVATLIRNIMADARFDDDDEIFDAKYWDPKRMMVQTLLGPLYGIPVLGSELEAMGMTAAGERPFEGSLIEVGGDVGRVVKNFPDYFTGDIEDLDRAFRDAHTMTNAVAAFSENAAAATAILNAIRDVFRIADNIEGPD